jgi:DNA-directed RNA polymerase specialized sigma subunit
MKYKPAALGMGTPSDGLLDEEKELQTIITRESLRRLYKKLPTFKMRFIVATHFDAGMSQEDVADIMGITQASLNDVYIRAIRRVLKGQPYKPQKHRPKVDLKVAMQHLLLLSEE